VAILGVSDHGGWAIFVTVSHDGVLLDRRRVQLVDDAMPAIPHHHEAQTLPEKEGVALVERVRASAERYAAQALAAVATDVPDIATIALRSCPQLPPTIAERIKDVLARNNADWVMYRQALAGAAQTRGWNVLWHDTKGLSKAARLPDRKQAGPPWNSDHKLAMALAIAALAVKRA
jgi:hypothetical protein